MGTTATISDRHDGSGGDGEVRREWRKAGESNKIAKLFTIRIFYTFIERETGERRRTSNIECKHIMWCIATTPKITSFGVFFSPLLLLFAAAAVAAAAAVPAASM